MSGYRHPPPPSPPPSERRWNRAWFTVGAVIIGAVILSLAGFLTWAFRPPTPDECAKIEPPRPSAAQGMGTSQEQEKEGPVIIPGFVVGDGEFIEPPVSIATTIDGKDAVLLRHQWLPEKEMEVPVTELKLVSRNAKQTAIGVCAGKRAERQGNLRTRNRAFLRQWRVACAAFTGFCCRPCGRPGMSYVAHTQYSQLRKRGAKLVASKASTKYAPYYPYFRKGDYLFFWKSSNRIGHVEVSMGGGWTVGTSSSAGYVARRRVGNRGFRTFSVVRL